MKDSKRNEIRKVVEPIVENILRTLFFWTRDDKEFGQMVINFHILIFCFFIIVTVLINIIRLPLAFIASVVVLALIILAQHYFIGICILSSIEKRTTGATYPMTEPFLKFFGIPVTTENIRGVTCLILTLFMASLILQLIRQSIFGR
jgi:hypothetical protein